MLLFLNSIGGMEIIVILLFILMFFGSKSIPSIARTLGKGLREVQHASNEIRNEIKNSTDQIKKDALLGNEFSDTIDTFKSLSDKKEETISKITKEINNYIQPVERKISEYENEIEDSIKLEPKKPISASSTSTPDTTPTSTTDNSITDNSITKE
jgi:sec-independent protein translocase protein TatA